jgi:hypothetical protein
MEETAGQNNKQSPHGFLEVQKHIRENIGTETKSGT